MTRAPYPSSLWEIAVIIGTVSIFVGAGVTAMAAAGWLFAQFVTVTIPQVVLQVGALAFDVLTFVIAGALAVCVVVAVLTWLEGVVYRLRRRGAE